MYSKQNGVGRTNRNKGCRTVAKNQYDLKNPAKIERSAKVPIAVSLDGYDLSVHSSTRK